jgi:hypothetical protein
MNPLRPASLLCAALALALLSACAAPASPAPVLPATPIETADPGPCGYTWGSQPLPELSAQVLEKLQAAGLPASSALAEAYGEDCRYADGTLGPFAVMETDYRLTLTVSTLEDPALLGSLLEQSLAILAQFPVESTPGPQPGYIGITFKNGEQVQNLWFERRKSDDLLAQGLRGAELYQALTPSP